MKKKKYRVIPGDGIPCPRCERPTQIREHTEITAKHLRQPYYFTRWFFCKNPHCVVTLHMVEEFKIWNDSATARKIQAARAERQQAPKFDDVVMTALDEVILGPEPPPGYSRINLARCPPGWFGPHDLTKPPWE